MTTTTLTRASRELFSRSPDERFASLQELWQHCYDQKVQSSDQWHSPMEVRAAPMEGRLDLDVGGSKLRLNDWSFGQVCRLAGVSKETLNRLSPDTASRVLHETIDAGSKPLQVLTQDDTVRAIHGAAYTRLHNVDLLTMVREFATDFQPPQTGMNGATGMYCGEQDMFCFLIDPTGWAEIDGQAFAPGFFLWNSEVGRRSVGIQTFWFQKLCQNHIVWDAIEVVDFSRKHTANVHESVREIRRLIESLVNRRDERRDGFVAVLKKAMHTTLGDKAEDVEKVLTQRGISRSLAKQALQIAEAEGRFTIFSLVDALTRLTGKYEYAGDRAEADEKVSSLLALAA